MSLLKAVKESTVRTYRKGKQITRLSKGYSEEARGSTRFNKKMAMADLMGLSYERFSNLLPYRYYDSEDELFINDESLGFACEVAPLSGANEEIINTLSDLIKNKIDHTVCMQVMLIGSQKVAPYLSGIADKASGTDAMFSELAQNQLAYFNHAAIKGVANRRGLNLTLKDYRCFIFIGRRIGYSKATAAKMCDLRADVMTEFRNAGIYNESLGAVDFCSVIKMLINPGLSDINRPITSLDKYKELNQQVVDPSFGMKVYPNHLETSSGEATETQVVSLSLKSLPDEIALWAQPDNYSNIFKPNFNIPCPFVISVHFMCEPSERSKFKAFKKSSGLEKKANSPYAKFIPGTVQAAEDWKKIRDDLAGGAVNLCKVFYNCTLFTDAKNRRDHVSKAIAAFRLGGFDMYAIKYQQLQSYLAMLPFVAEQGLWFDLSMFGRLNTMTTWNLTNLLPLVAEYKGTQSGRGVLAPTFRGQIAQIDNYASVLDNFNVCVTATSGAGKSVLSQALIASVLSDGGKVWVIDLGQSYKKLCETLGGTYMDVSSLRLNPFSGVTDIGRSAESIRDLIAVMASPNEGLSDVQEAHLLEAVRNAYEKNKNKSNIDDVIDSLRELNKKAVTDLRVDDIITLLKKYSPSNSYVESAAVRIFNNESLLDNGTEEQERFVVLELGELEEQPDLMKAVLFALILSIEEQMYRGRQTRKKMCVIDEAWNLLSGSNKTAAAFIEKGFRTARRHNGSFVTITQKINDFYDSSEAQAAWSCAEIKVIMRQNDKYFKDFLNDRPDYFSDYEQKLIQNFKPSSVNGFSEFMVQQGATTSFHRLFLDPFSRIMYSSRSEDRKSVEDLVSEGQTVNEAIMSVAGSQFGDEITSIKEQL